MDLLRLTSMLALSFAVSHCNEAEFGSRGVKPGTYHENGGGTATGGDNPFGNVNGDGFGNSVGIDGGATFAGGNAQGGAINGDGGTNSDGTGTGEGEFGGEVSLDHCADQSKLKTVPLSVVFQGTMNNGCSMQGGSGGNDRIKAAGRQIIDIPLPNNKLLCSLNLSGSNPQFKYDDILFFGIQNFFVATSHQTDYDLNSWGMPKAGNAMRIDTGRFWGHLKYGLGRYCMPGASCTIPISQQTGNFTINFPVAAARNLPKEELAKPNLQFTLIIAGNGERKGDNFDCSHNGMSLNGTATYISH